jgi:hypothetical protein
MAGEEMRLEGIPILHEMFCSLIKVFNLGDIATIEWGVIY